ncbi:hypothetical protein MLD38_030595 [Melastoma candidum]|uniref:Uncharacterized protein n=1 Tax=Melastoma candidum TaxID=119954 RepID=A0ACB9MM81_9MYRT|nr:hypothetical protein MLD38_030595 [Melastoma candidum]
MWCNSIMPFSITVMMNSINQGKTLLIFCGRMKGCFHTEIQVNDEKTLLKASPNHDASISFFEEQLKKIEEELAIILKVLSSKVDGTLGNIQIQQLLQLLEDITHVRKRELGAMHQHAQA